MKKNLLIRVLFLTAALFLLAFAASAESADRPLGYLPERGVSLPMTQEDADMGIAVSYLMGSSPAFPSLPIFYLSYTDYPTIEEIYSRYAGADLKDEATVMALFNELVRSSFSLYEVALFDSAVLEEQLAAGATIESLIGVSGFTLLGENDGYTYAAVCAAQSASYASAELEARVMTAAARAKELLDALSYIPVVFAPGEVTSAPDAFPAFETVDLDGNPVTHAIFGGKDLTVVNVWGTFCNPCIEEMPDLAAWSEAMPENVQLIGLVSDLPSAEDADTLELARAICEATGANVYPSLIAGEDFAGLLSGVIGVPTTFFVDSEGRIVGQPIVGANVEGCKRAVEALLAAM